MRNGWLRSYHYSVWVCFLPSIAQYLWPYREVNGPSVSNFQAIQSDWVVSANISWRIECFLLLCFLFCFLFCFFVFCFVFVSVCFFVLFLDEAFKWCCIQNEQYRGQAQSLEEHRSPLQNTQNLFSCFWWFLVAYEDIKLLLPVRKLRPKPVQGCSTNAKVMFEAREKNVEVYCIKGCREIQKQENPPKIIIGRTSRSEKIIQYAEKNSHCAVPTPVSRLMDAEQIVCWQMRDELLKNKFFFSRRFDRKGR